MKRQNNLVESPLPRPFTITAIKTENCRTKTFVLAGALTARPGQFVMAWLPDMPDKPFSLANANPLTLTIAAVGPMSEAIHRLTVGDSLWVRGPLGQGYRLPTDMAGGGYVLLMGGGYGAAPLQFLARQALAADWRVAVILGAKTAAELLLLDDFAALGVTLHPTTEDGSAGLPGLVTDALTPIRAAMGGPPATIYACGPTGMLKAISAYATAESIPAQLSWEAPMRCGIGLCGSCELGAGWLTCLDGPVFDFDPLL